MVMVILFCMADTPFYAYMHYALRGMALLSPAVPWFVKLK
jgi:hypothetical protein